MFYRLVTFGSKSFSSLYGGNCSLPSFLPYSCFSPFLSSKRDRVSAKISILPIVLLNQRIVIHPPRFSINLNSYELRGDAETSPMACSMIDLAFVWYRSGPVLQWTSSVLNERINEKFRSYFRSSHNIRRPRKNDIRHRSLPHKNTKSISFNNFRNRYCPRHGFRFV